MKENLKKAQEEAEIIRQKRLAEEEAERLDNMDSWKARILGISKKDAI